MLSKEEIEKRLASIKKVQSWVDVRMSRLDALAPATREVALFLIGCDSQGRPLGEEKAGHTYHSRAEKISRLNSDELFKLGESMFPRFADVFRAAWDIHNRLPMQHGYARKPFRAPNRPELLLDARRAFVSTLVRVLEGYDEDLPWIAAHAAHIVQYGAVDHIGLLLAAAIDLGGKRGEEVEQILRDSAAGTHEIAEFGRHVTTGLLCNSKPDCWEFMGKMLLAAQRQEGLRQSILETIDFSHPDAFRAMLRVIDENNLVRFSATVRAAGVWLGLQLDSASAKYVEETLQAIAKFLDDDAARAVALRGDDAEKAFFALWSVAFNDAPAAAALAIKLLSHRKPETRFVSLFLLQMLGLDETYSATLDSVNDEDLRVAAYATAIVSERLRTRMYFAEQRVATPWTPGQAYRRRVSIPPKDSGDLFERLERLYPRMPEKSKPQKALVWPWMKIKSEREGVANAMLLALGERSPARLLPFIDEMDPTARCWVAGLLGLAPQLDAGCRGALLKLVGDASHSVREAAIDSMRKVRVSAEDLAVLEPLLERKASDLRRGVLSLILSADDSAALQCAKRLLDSKPESQRLAGLDLLVQMKDVGRSTEQVADLAGAYKSARPELSRDQGVYIEKLLAHEQATVSLDDGLGLMNPSKRTPPIAPVMRNVTVLSEAAIELIKSLDELIHSHREDTITFKTYGGEVKQLPLGSAEHGFPRVYNHTRGQKKTAENWRSPLEELPLKDVWFGWWQARPKATRDADGLEAARASIAISSQNEHRLMECAAWKKEILAKLLGRETPKLRYRAVCWHVLHWILAYETPAGLADYALDTFESLAVRIPEDKLTLTSQYGQVEFRHFLAEFRDVDTFSWIAEGVGQWTSSHTRRSFSLRRWEDEPGVEVDRSRPDWSKEMLPAFKAGFANEHDLIDSLLGPRSANRYSGNGGFMELSTATTQLRRGQLPTPVVPLVWQVIERILEIELKRGEQETPATGPAQSMTYVGGYAVLIRVLEAIGNDPKLNRTYTWGDASKGKSVVFSHLIRATFPSKDDSIEAFVKAAKAARINEDALLAVAFYAPQWARFIQAAVGWEMLEEVVWWFHAHTKDTSWHIDRDTREAWNAEVRKLTPLALEDLVDGAVDVEWFERTYKALGPKRWARLDEFAKFASRGAGHSRAQLFAAAMLGKAKKSELSQGIVKKRKQDAVRAIGLLPLDKKGPKKDLLARYQLIQEFVRQSRQFGSMRQASEKLAARIGQENLARTAGYPDPVRLQWAMEGLASKDLADGPVVVKVKDVAVSLALDESGLPEVTVARNGKPLKAIPPEAKKNTKVVELQERKTDLRRSASRMRQSLELAMCRGDRFTRDQLVELMGNVVLRPMLERLVFVGDGVAGYPEGGGKALRNHGGKVEPVKKGELLHLAHPVDLLKNWSRWQRDCFAAERVQPFKQVFRELYVLTGQEKSDSTFSRRYAGQQVNPRQAMALLGSRGWIAAPEVGVFRTFHDEKLVAWLEFMEPFFTPADVEGLTLEKVRFAKRGGTEYLKLTDLPLRLFSEVMRDVDLVVSVAHRGAVGPEASASTVELRSSLLRETTRLLKLENVKIKEPHVHIKGSLAEYSVHLGSATTHMLPGGTLSIVPVHSQHRGRIFLPFADDDPKTAEIISKVLLLARDQELRDPNLLDQIRSRFA